MTATTAEGGITIPTGVNEGTTIDGGRRIVVVLGDDPEAMMIATAMMERISEEEALGKETTTGVAIEGRSTAGEAVAEAETARRRGRRKKKSKEYLSLAS